MSAKVRQPASTFAQRAGRKVFVCVSHCVPDSSTPCLYQGAVYGSHEQWEVDVCTSCTCVSGDVHCQSQRCPLLTCATVSVNQRRRVCEYCD